MLKQQFLNTDYDIYEDGRCYSHKTHKFMKPSLLNGYYTYNITYPDGTKKRTKAHRMVAITFIPNPNDLPIVNHKDGIKTNNNVDNLEWTDAKGNSQHAFEMKLIPKTNQTKITYNKNSDTENEIWEDTFGFKNYRVSSSGRVMNKNTQRLLKIQINSTGYNYCKLWEHNKESNILIHRLVFESFNKRAIKENHVINHKDGNKLNNNLDNLEETTYQVNNLHAVNIIKTNMSCKKIHQFDLNDNYIKSFDSIAEAYRETGINNISRAALYDRTAGGYKWKYDID